MRQGFTLLEFLIVLAVLAILGGVAAVSFNAYIQSSRLNQAAQEVAEALRSVGSRALTESRGYTITLTTGPGSRLEWVNSQQTVGSLSVPHNVQIVSLNPAGSTIEYVGRGFPVRQYRIGLQLGSRPVREVVLLPTGKVVTP